MLPPKSRTYRLLTVLAILLLGVLVVGQVGSMDVQEEKWALIVGISDYQHVNDLQFADQDAEAMYKLLTEQAGFVSQDELYTTFLLNEEATKAAIIDALERKLPQAKPNDLILIYFSGHGSFLEDTDGDESDGWDEGLVPYDAVQGNEGSMIIDDEFGYKIKRLKAKQVIVILDACYSGGAGKTTNVMSVRGQPSGSVFKDIFTQPEGSEGRMLLTASQPDQVAHERPELKHGLFTYFLLEALEGKGDENRDGAVTIQEAFTYAERHVDEYVKEHGLVSLQTPIMKDQLRKEITVTLVGCPKLVGTITIIVPDKEVARQDDKVLINLGTNADIQIGGIFEVYHEYSSKATGSVKETRGRIKIIEVIGENRSLAKVIKSKIPIEVGDQIKKICKFEAPISENKPPELTSIDFPSKVTADGNEVKGIINFKDPDGDIAKVEFNVLESKDFESFDFNPEIRGQKEGAFEFPLSTDTSQKVRLKVTLIDSRGNRSEAKEITFQAVKPIEPAFFKIWFLAVDPPTPVIGQQVAIRAVVENTGEKTATKLIKLYINDVRKKTRTITLAPDRKETVSFKFTFSTERNYRIEARTSDSECSITIQPKRSVMYSHFLSNKDYDRVWDETREIEGKEISELINTPYNRKLILRPLEDRNKINHEIRPISPGLLKVIGKTTIDITNKKVELEGKGFIQTAKAIFDLEKEERRLEFRTWGGKLTRSEVAPLNTRNLGDLSLTSLAFIFVNTEALETVVVDIITDVNGKAIAVATTEVFNNIKILSVKTINPSGFKPSELDIPPHILTFSHPRQVVVNQQVEFRILAFDPDGKMEKLNVKWGDGNTSSITDPSSGMLTVTHRYNTDGTFTIKFTSTDNEGQEASFIQDLEVIKRIRKEKEEEQGGGKKQGGTEEPSGTIEAMSVE